jgi:molecular chaperone GrpE
MSESARDNEDTGVEDLAAQGGASDAMPPQNDTEETSVDQPVPEGKDAGEASRGDEGSQADQDLQAELTALREQFEGLNDRHLRLVAEFNNFKRRSEQERLSAWARAQAELTGRLLDVLDDLQRVAGLDLTNATVEAIMEGVDLVERKFVRTLDDAGIETIEPDGIPFDPELMEAMMRVPAEADDQVDRVAQVFQRGYLLKGNLIRPARVSVYTQS